MPIPGMNRTLVQRTEGAELKIVSAEVSAHHARSKQTDHMLIRTHSSIFFIAAAAIALATLTAQPALAAQMAQPSFHTKGSPTGKPTGPLKPGEYWWNPKVSPEGPVVMLVSLPLQTMHVYRNGILVGAFVGKHGVKGPWNTRPESSLFSRKSRVTARRNTRTPRCRTCSG